MIKLQQLKMPLQHTTADLIKKSAALLHISEKDITSFEILKRSIDARKKEDVCFKYTVAFQCSNAKNTAQEIKLCERNKKAGAVYWEPVSYCFPETMGSSNHSSKRPVVVGSGPCGLFCAYLLSVYGYRPILLERGAQIEERTKQVTDFWSGKAPLNITSNVQFGEGGAGTFSDGKLNTLVNDKYGRNRFVLETFVKFGAPEEILYEGKPHIGTDILYDVIRNMRKELSRLGCEIRFSSCVTDLKITKGTLEGVVINHEEFIAADTLVLAIGHSARDTFEMLSQHKLFMEPKAFAVGMRIEHPQSNVNLAQYGEKAASLLPAAPYKVTAQSMDGRGVYSFCMCPGGYVVDASSETGRIAVNGMSYGKRDSFNANSALVVTVSPADYGAEGPLSGVYFQRKLEEKAFQIGNGNVPQQLYGDYKEGYISNAYGEFSSCIKGQTHFANLNEIFPEAINQALKQGITAIGTKIRGFDRPDAILSGVESRTSSPVRIIRNERYQSNISGIYPAGEGAGYAGGIMSAAMDGMKVAEAIAASQRG